MFGIQMSENVPPPPPLPNFVHSLSMAPPLPPVVPPPPPPLQGLLVPTCLGNFYASKSPAFSGLGQESITAPAGSNNLRKLQWQKVPFVNPGDKECLWNCIADKVKFVQQKMNFQKIDELFTVTPKAKNNANLGPDVADKNKPKDIYSLLDAKKCMNLNIVLRQLSMSADDIVNWIFNNNSLDERSSKIGDVLKALPGVDELDRLRDFTETDAIMGTAEKVCLKLSKTKGCKHLLHLCALKSEFQQLHSSISTYLDVMTESCQVVLTNETLRDILIIVLVTGNYLNQGSYVGSAKGFKLSSIPVIKDMKSADSKLGFLNFIVDELEKSGGSVGGFKELEILGKATTYSITSLRKDVDSIKQLSSKIQNLGKIALESDVAEKVEQFSRTFSSELKNIEERMWNIEELNKRVARFFCEDENTFKIEDCFKILSMFSENCSQVKRENEMRRQANMEAEKRRLSKTCGVCELNRVDSIKRKSLSINNSGDKITGGFTNQVCDEGGKELFEILETAKFFTNRRSRHSTRSTKSFLSDSDMSSPAIERERRITADRTQSVTLENDMLVRSILEQSLNIVEHQPANIEPKSANATDDSFDATMQVVAIDNISKVNELSKLTAKPDFENNTVKETVNVEAEESLIFKENRSNVPERKYLGLAKQSNLVKSRLTTSYLELPNSTSNIASGRDKSIELTRFKRIQSIKLKPHELPTPRMQRRNPNATTKNEIDKKASETFTKDTYKPPVGLYKCQAGELLIHLHKGKDEKNNIVTKPKTKITFEGNSIGTPNISQSKVSTTSFLSRIHKKIIGESAQQIKIARTDSVKSQVTAIKDVSAKPTKELAQPKLKKNEVIVQPTRASLLRESIRIKNKVEPKSKDVNSRSR